jgi:hypothetical protein
VQSFSGVRFEVSSGYAIVQVMVIEGLLLHERGVPYVLKRERLLETSWQIHLLLTLLENNQASEHGVTPVIFMLFGFGQEYLPG